MSDLRNSRLGRRRYESATSTGRRCTTASLATGLDEQNTGFDIRGQEELEAVIGESGSR